MLLDVSGSQHAFIAVRAVVREDAPVVVQVVLVALAGSEALRTDATLEHLLHAGAVDAGHSLHAVHIHNARRL